MVQATLIGFIAILMWSLLAVLTSLSGAVPPFLLCGLAFCVATAVGLVYIAIRRPVSARRDTPAAAWVVGVGGLFGYHFFYFSAVRNAPVVEANLINYLWPLLIVLGSALMPGEKLRAHHIVGAMLGLSGTALIVTDGGHVMFDNQFLAGYALALAAAFAWSSYSLASRRFSAVPTQTVTWFCAGAAVLSMASHLMWEETVLPANSVEWLAVVGLGLMPVGGAFFVWDYGVKHGNIHVLGAASYLAPLLSTLILVGTGLAELTISIGLACLLISAGVVLASRDMLFRAGRFRTP